MKASELRIGNIVGTPIGISRVLEVSELWIYAEPINYDGGCKIVELSKVKPIPLTRDFIDRFELNWHEGIYIKDGIYIFMYDDHYLVDGIGFENWGKNAHPKKFFFVHQLQNIFITLRDIELKLRK